MFDKLRKLAGKARDAAATAAVAVGDLNHDGKVDEQDAKIAADWARKAVGTVADEAGRLGKEAMRSELVKDAASGAAIGAVVAIPLPVVGPLAGAAIGAGLGVYKNFTKEVTPSSPTPDRAQIDTHAQLLKLADLRDKGILSEAEFDSEKQKLLKGDSSA